MITAGARQRVAHMHQSAPLCRVSPHTCLYPCAFPGAVEQGGACAHPPFWYYRKWYSGLTGTAPSSAGLSCEVPMRPWPSPVERAPDGLRPGVCRGRGITLEVAEPRAKPVRQQRSTPCAMITRWCIWTCHVGHPCLLRLASLQGGSTERAGLKPLLLRRASCVCTSTCLGPTVSPGPTGGQLVCYRTVHGLEQGLPTGADSWQPASQQQR